VNTPKIVQLDVMRLARGRARDDSNGMTSSHFTIAGAFSLPVEDSIHVALRSKSGSLPILEWDGETFNAQTVWIQTKRKYGNGGWSGKKHNRRETTGQIRRRWKKAAKAKGGEQ